MIDDDIHNKVNGMDNILEHLERDTLPTPLLNDFVSWCIWQQARPALSAILERVGLQAEIKQLQYAEDYHALASTSQTIAQHITEIRKQTGPLGLSTAEAAAFLMQKLAIAAQKDEVDAAGVSFFTMQLVGWSGFATSSFTDASRKSMLETEARKAQATQLETLWREYGGNQ